jgi:16S rRNA (guanine1207-N2)-methyltransferase
MMPSRLELLLANAVRGRAPGARVVLLHASAATVLRGVLEAGAHRVHVVHRRLPDLESLLTVVPEADRATRVMAVHSHGRVGLPAALEADLVVIELPPERVTAQQLLYDAAMLLRTGGTLLLAGETASGIKPAVAFAEALFGAVQVVAQGGGGRVASAVRAAEVQLTAGEGALHPYEAPDAFRLVQDEVAGVPLTIATRPGVFSWDHVDVATRLLAETATVRDGARVLDLGCGAGVLAACLATKTPSSVWTLVDADSEAVRCAARTMQATWHGAWEVLASDVERAVTGRTFDLVVCNPPFHHGRHTDLVLPRRFLAGAHAVLRSGGRLQLVANRTLPYEAELERLFGDRRVLAERAGFKVLEAVRG